MCVSVCVMGGRRGGSEIFLNFNKRGGGGVNFKKSGNELNKRLKCLILMLNLRVSKRTKSENSKNKVIIKRVSNISIN